MLFSLRGSGYIPHQHFHSQIAASPSFLHINLWESLQNQLNAGSLVEGHGQEFLLPSLMDETASVGLK